MKVFISWSGELSHNVAVLLKELIEDVLQASEPWISSEDIKKGSIWFGDIKDALQSTSIGVLCLTQENVDAPWVLFEAGALTGGLESSVKVCPFLIDIKTPTDLKPPLSQFNATLPVEEEVRKLLDTINESLGDNQLSEANFMRAFGKYGGGFSVSLELAKEDHPLQSVKETRSVEDKTDELLGIARSIQSQVRDLASESRAPSESSEVSRRQSREDIILDEVSKKRTVRNIAEDILEKYAGKGLADSNDLFSKEEVSESLLKHIESDLEIGPISRTFYLGLLRKEGFLDEENRLSDSGYHVILKNVKPRILNIPERQDKIE